MIAQCATHGAYDLGTTTALLPCPICVVRGCDAARAALRGLLGAIDRAQAPNLHRSECPARRLRHPHSQTGDRTCRCGAYDAVRAARAAVPEQGGTE